MIIFEPLVRDLQMTLGRRHPTDGELGRVGITRDRLDEILRSATHLAGVTLDEYIALWQALGLGTLDRPDASQRPTLGEREWDALEAASAVAGWDDPTMLGWWRSARRMMAEPGIRRLRFTTVDDWIEFARWCSENFDG